MVAEPVWNAAVENIGISGGKDLFAVADGQFDLAGNHKARFFGFVRV